MKQTSGEQNLEYYSLFQEYLALYERTLEKYIKTLGVSPPHFFEELIEVKNDTTIKDKKFV